MSALNSAETEALQNAQACLQYILEHGYNPDDADKRDPQAIYTQVQLKRAKDGVKTVVTMKGHYPK